MLYIENIVCYLFYHFKGYRDKQFFTLEISQQLYSRFTVKT
jgi:hypothetical protein